jgi:uncharacterized protein (DUF362 family)
MGPTVIVEKMASETAGLTDQFSRSIGLLSLRADFERARAVFIKPNLTYPTYRQGVTTRREFIESLVAALRGINSTTRLYIGEGDGGYHSFSMTEAMQSMGFESLERDYPNVSVINLSEVSSREVMLEAKGRPYHVRLPELILDEIDFSITCPLPKVHCMTGITLSLKNQWGCLPDTMRLRHHHAFDEIIGQICMCLKVRYAFLDGKYGLDNNGPIAGNQVELGWFAASNSPGAFDVVISEMMGFRWEKIRHLKKAERYGLIPQRDAIDVVGSIDSLRKKFMLRRTLWNYPALAAFRSEELTHFFYLSNWAKGLHDLMYLIRPRPM